MTLDRAKALLATDPHRARALARAAGSGLEARFVAAAAARRCGDPAGALALLDGLPAARAWGPAYERGAALAQLGRPAEAVAALGQALALNPGAAIAAHALDGELRLTGGTVPGRVAEALAAVRQPDGPFVRAALHDAPLPGLDRHDPCWLRLLADAALAMGHEDRAEALLAEACARAPDYAAAQLDLAMLCERQQRGPEALERIAPLAARHPQNPRILALLAAAQLHCGAIGPALAASQEALALAPDDPGLWHAHGHALRIAGQRAAAVAAYRRALALAPHRTEPWWSLANLKGAELGPHDLAAMRDLLASDLPAGALVHLHFALGHAALDSGDPAEAMARFAAANAIRHAERPFDLAAHAGFVDRAIATFDAAFFAARAGWGDPTPGPVFIVGMPRSGSTLVEQMLASHPAIEGLSELPDLTRQARQATLRLIGAGRAADAVSAVAALTAAEVAEIGAAYRAQVDRRRQTARPFFIDKAPGNLLQLALLHLALPGARIIDVRRAPLACCFSLYIQDFAAGQAHTFDLATLGRTYRLNQQLADHFAAVLPAVMTSVALEDLVAGPEAALGRLLAHCGLPFDPACLRFHDNPRPVRTASSEQVRRPLDPTRDARWRACEPWLGPLVTALS